MDKREVLRLLKRELKSWRVDEVCEFDERRLRDLLVWISIDWLVGRFRSGGITCYCCLFRSRWEESGGLGTRLDTAQKTRM